MTSYNFKSIFAHHLEEYISLRVSNGYSETSFNKLIQFDTFLCEMEYRENYLSREIVNLWCVQKESEGNNNQIKRINNVKLFCEYLNFIGIKANIPSVKVNSSKHVPYVMSIEEVQLFFNALDSYYLNVYDSVGFFKFMIPVMMRLYYLCGMRNNEVCTLRFEDIDHSRKAFKINGKNQKERFVYMSNDTYQMIVMYSQRMRIYSLDGWLFPNRNSNKPFLNTSVCKAFTRVVSLTGIGTHDFHPTPHSLRHTYVVHRIDQWIDDGNDVKQLIPYLSKQLGHSTPVETFYYYHMLLSSYKPVSSSSRNLYPEVMTYEEEE